jgi:hypothetical protein
MDGWMEADRYNNILKHITEVSAICNLTPTRHIQEHFSLLSYQFNVLSVLVSD